MFRNKIYIHKKNWNTIINELFKTNWNTIDKGKKLQTIFCYLVG